MFHELFAIFGDPGRESYKIVPKRIYVILPVVPIPENDINEITLAYLLKR